MDKVGILFHASFQGLIRMKTKTPSQILPMDIDLTDVLPSHVTGFDTWNRLDHLSTIMKRQGFSQPSEIPETRVSRAGG
jgi:hypothetical protein